MTEISLTEAQVKHDCEQYLKKLMGYGKLWYCRLNAGTFGRHHNIQGVAKGTADIMVIHAGQHTLEYMGVQKGPVVPVALVTFVELKSSDGKLRKEQIEFEAQITGFHCRYVVVRSLTDLQEALER